jgi:hypothetical protein
VLNNKLKVKGIFYDIEKAFDCVNHNILLHKMEICRWNYWDSQEAIYSLL